MKTIAIVLASILALTISCETMDCRTYEVTTTYEVIIHDSSKVEIPVGFDPGPKTTRVIVCDQLDWEKWVGEKTTVLVKDGYEMTITNITTLLN